MIQFHDEKEFEKITAEDLPPGTFEYCTFLQCDFRNGDLSGRIFVDCTFIECDLSNAKILECSFQTTRFDGCKLMGLRFETCKSMMFSLHLENTRLELCTFTGMNLRNFSANSCELYDVDFSGADLKGASLSGCDLRRSVFIGCNLGGTDFRNTENLVLNPEENTLTGAYFSKDGLEGLLTRYQLKIQD